VSCPECAPLASRHEALHRAFEAARAGLAEAEKERDGLQAELHQVRQDRDELERARDQLQARLFTLETA
jgi:chromosome segregation ATPase